MRSLPVPVIPDVMLVAVAVFGLLWSRPLAGQEFRATIDDFAEPDISVWTQVEDSRGWIEESRRRLQTSKPGRSFRNYQVYFTYNEGALFPRSPENCFLHLFIVDPGRSDTGSPETIRVWYRTFRLNVEGDFVDRNVDLRLSIERDGVVERGTLGVVAHSSSPVTVLQPRFPEIMTVDVRTNAGDNEGLPIEFANRSRCCEILFKEGRVVRWDKALWGEPKLTTTKSVLPPGREGAFQEWLSLGLRPKSSEAFWRSFSPFEDDAPHSELVLKVKFQVQGGREDEIQQKVRVRFRPPWLLVLLSVAAGASLSSILSLLIVKIRRGARPLFTTAKTMWERSQEILKRLFLSMFVALAIFFVYLLVKGNKDVVLFDFPLDPTQCLPAFVIGLFVGSRPEVYFIFLMSRWKPPAGGAAALLLALVVSGLSGGAPLHAQSPTVAKSVIRPVDLEYNAATDSLYVLSSPSNRIYRLTLPKGPLQEVFRLSTDETATSQCLLEWQGSSWLASLTARILGNSRLWAVTVYINSLDGKGSLVRRFTGFGQFHGIACDGERQRLLLVDRLREGIYTIPLLANGIGEPSLLVRDAWLKESVAIAIRGTDAFVAARGRRAVIQVNLETGTVRPVVQDLSEPIDVVLTPDGSHLMVTDTGQARVLEVDLASGLTRERIGNSHLREPKAAQVDRRGRIWVVDSWLEGVLEFGPDGGRPLRRIP